MALPALKHRKSFASPLDEALGYRLDFESVSALGFLHRFSLEEWRFQLEKNIENFAASHAMRFLATYLL
jgi:hypothetical protein